jgi:enolase
LNIRKIKAIRVFDSRGYPTIKCFVETDNELSSAIVPSGTSSGINEAFELRDKGNRYCGYDVSKAIKNINEIIAKKLEGEFVLDQERIDNLLIELDGTANKSNLGANAILAVSLACCRAASDEMNMPLFEYISNLNKSSKISKKFNFPLPHLNIINGGEHAGSNLAFQEFQIIPKFKDFSLTMQASCEVYHTLKKIIKNKIGSSSTNVGYEGGFVPNISDPKIAINLIQDSIDKCKYSKEIKIGLDCAANSFYNINTNKYEFNNKEFNYKELSFYYIDLIKDYNVKSIEDPFYENQKNEWKYFYNLVNNKINIIGDDLLVTNPKLIKEAISKKLCNSLLLKVNQIGTLSQSIDAFNIAKKANWKIQISHRSGESEDDFIADLAFGLQSDSIKFGAPSRSERTVKYNRLLEIYNFY